MRCGAKRDASLAMVEELQMAAGLRHKNVAIGPWWTKMVDQWLWNSRDVHCMRVTAVWSTVGLMFVTQKNEIDLMSNRLSPHKRPENSFLGCEQQGRGF